MLRLRLFYGLLTLLILLWGVGVAAVMLIRESDKRFTDLQLKYPPIRAAQGFRTVTSTLNHHYVAPMVRGDRSDEMDRALLERQRLELMGKMQILQGASADEAQWHEVVGRLDQAVKDYMGTLEGLMKDPVEESERARVVELVSMRTQRVTDLSENVLTLAEQQLFLGVRRSKLEARMNVLFIVTLGLLATAVAGVIYFQLARRVVDPVAALRRSIQEIRKGNYELMLPSMEKEGEIGGVVEAINEMAAELKLRRGEMDERLMRTNLVNRAILGAIPSPVYVLGPDGKILQINPAAERLNEVLGVEGRLPAKLQRLVERCREEGVNHAPEDPREAMLFRVEEREHYYLPRVFQFSSEDGQKTGWAVLMHNVTKIRWLDDMKTNLLSTVSHEIKTPLTGIRMSLHLLQEDREKRMSEIQRTMIDTASEECERLLSTLNSLLDLSRAESGATHLQCELMDLGQALERAAQVFEPKAKEREVTIGLEVEEGLPRVMADPLRIGEVVNNLISNAIKHAPRGSRVDLRLMRPVGAEYLRVSFVDRGPGVPEEAEEKIFERFYRVPGQAHEGAGLGLFISREIVRAHEGRIGLGERRDGCTEFFIEIPVGRALGGSRDLEDLAV